MAQCDAAHGLSLFFFDGNCDVEARDYSFLVPEAHFLPLDIQEIYEAAFASTKRPEEITALIYPVKDHLKRKLQAFLHRFDIQLQIAENALAIPLNIPLGVALTEFVAEMELPVIALHHDFFWERKRFLKNCCRMPTHTPIW